MEHRVEKAVQYGVDAQRPRLVHDRTAGEGQARHGLSALMDIALAEVQRAQLAQIGSDEEG